MVKNSDHIQRELVSVQEFVCSRFFSWSEIIVRNVGHRKRGVSRAGFRREPLTVLIIALDLFFLRPRVFVRRTTHAKIWTVLQSRGFQTSTVYSLLHVSIGTFPIFLSTLQYCISITSSFFLFSFMSFFRCTGACVVKAE